VSTPWWRAGRRQAPGGAGDRRTGRLMDGFSCVSADGCSGPVHAAHAWARAATRAGARAIVVIAVASGQAGGARRGWGQESREHSEHVLA